MSLRPEQKPRLVFLDSVQRTIDEEYDLFEALGLKDGDSLDSDRIKSAAIERVTSSLKITRSYSDPIEHYPADQRLVSYPVSRILVSLTDNPFLFYMFSVSEARRFVNQSKKVSGAVSTGKDTDSVRYDQVKILNELGYNSVTTDGIPIELYLSKVPTEEEAMTETVDHYGSFDDTIDPTEELLDKVLFWSLVEEIREGLPADVPEEIADVLESETVDISQKIPNKFKVSKRGLAEDASYQNISKLIEHAPPVFRETAYNIRNNEPISSQRREMLLRTLLDCGVAAEDITDWMGYESEWTESYGQDELFDLQGDIQHEEYGFTSYTVTDLQSQGIFSDVGTIYRLTEYSPVYTVLKKNDQLRPTTIREKN